MSNYQKTEQARQRAVRIREAREARALARPLRTPDLYAT